MVFARDSLAATFCAVVNEPKDESGGCVYDFELCNLTLRLRRSSCGLPRSDRQPTYLPKRQLLLVCCAIDTVP
jgi:hypothetical protein